MMIDVKTYRWLYEKLKLRVMFICLEAIETQQQVGLEQLTFEHIFKRSWTIVIVLRSDSLFKALF